MLGSSKEGCLKMSKYQIKEESVCELNCGSSLQNSEVF